MSAWRRSLSCHCVLLGLLLLCFQAGSESALAVERIDVFSSTVTVRKDGGMRVREDITVTAEGDRIRKGIYREIPLRYSGPSAYRGLVPFTVVSVSLDGRRLEPVETEIRGESIRVLMRGDAPLTHGRHRFELVYDTSLRLRFYDGNGELNWNVTGVWSFPIVQASCRIILPDDVPIRRTAAWAGQAGSRDSGGIETLRPRPNEVLFTGENLRLSSGMQVTVAVSFAGAAIADPTVAFVERQRAEDAARERAEHEETLRRRAASREAWARGALFGLLYDNPRLPWQAVAFCLVFLYFFPLWRRLGLDPAKGTVVPRFHAPLAGYMGKNRALADEPPRPLSPLAVEFLRKATRITGRGLAATFLSLAFRGACVIRRADNKNFALEPRPLDGKTAATLLPEELAVYNGLKRHAVNGRLPLRPKDENIRAVFLEARGCLKRRFATAWRLNAWVAVLGWFVVMPLAFAVGFMGDDVLSFVAMPLMPALLFFGSFAVVLGLPFALPWRGSGRAYALALGLAAVVVCLLAVLYAGGVFQNLEWILPLCTVATAFFFTAVIKAPSAAARPVLDAVDGLAMYLRTAENPRMEGLSGPDVAPEDTPAVFRGMLPYALVLGLEKTWCNRFADLLDAGAASQANVDAALVGDGWDDFSQSFGGAVSAASSSAGASSSDSAFGSSGGGGAGSGSGGGGGGGL